MHRDGAVGTAAAFKPVAAVQWTERTLLVLDAAASALRVLETAKGDVSTLTGGRGDGHLDGQINVARFNSPREPALALFRSCFYESFHCRLP